MNQYHLQLESPWEEVREKLKEVHTELTDDDLRYEPGEEKFLLERLARKMNKTVAEVKGWIESVSYNKGIAS